MLRGESVNFVKLKAKQERALEQVLQNKINIAQTIFNKTAAQCDLIQVDIAKGRL